MKKIVSVLSVAALTLSAVFAADVSLSYRLGGSLYSETNSKQVNTTTGAKTVEQERKALDLEGYGDSGKGDLKFTANNDFAGFVLKVNVDDKGFTTDNVGEYYGWLNFSNIQLTTGKWDSRYVGRLDMHSGEWEGNEFERYKPGVINGKYANDIDNLTKVRYTKDGKDAWEQRLATAVAYTLHKDEDNALMVKGVLVDNDWGSTLRMDNDRWSLANANGKTYDKIGNGDLSFFSGFAGEFAYKTAGFDFNLAAKSMKRNELGLGAFFRTIGESSSLLFGLSAGFDLSDKKDAVSVSKTVTIPGIGTQTVQATADYAHNYREFAFDFRGHFELSDELCLTTMNNISVTNQAKVKDQKWEDMDFFLWDMVSLGYKVNEKLFAQFTVESECNLLKIHANHLDPKTGKPTNDSDGNELDGPFSQGGFTLTVTPGVVYSISENATITAGVALEWYNIGASPVKQDALYATMTKTSKIQIPVVFKVSL